MNLGSDLARDIVEDLILLSDVLFSWCGVSRSQENIIPGPGIEPGSVSTKKPKICAPTHKPTHQGTVLPLYHPGWNTEGGK